MPELVPFRLTCQMAGVLSPHDATEVLRRPMAAGMAALHDGAAILQVGSVSRAPLKSGHHNKGEMGSVLRRKWDLKDTPRVYLKHLRLGLTLSGLEQHAIMLFAFRRLLVLFVRPSKLCRISNAQ